MTIARSKLLRILLRWLISLFPWTLMCKTFDRLWKLHCLHLWFRKGYFRLPIVRIPLTDICATLCICQWWYCYQHLPVYIHQTCRWFKPLQSSCLYENRIYLPDSQQSSVVQDYLTQHPIAKYKVMTSTKSIDGKNYDCLVVHWYDPTSVIPHIINVYVDKDSWEIVSVEEAF